jgi:tellurite resistance protein
MRSSTPLKFLMPGWFSLVMGLCGLSLAWHRAAPALGEPAAAMALGLGWLAAGVFVLLLGASVLRFLRYPQALGEDLQHPVRHAFVAALPVSLLLLAAVGVALDGPEGAGSVLWRTLWWAGSLLQIRVSLWVLGRWLLPTAHSTAQATTAGHPSLWPGITPVLLIAVVGNVVAPLAGVPLGIEGWSIAQLAIGVFLWPVVFTLVLVRRMVHSPLPERMVASWFITLAPPSVVGLCMVQLQAPLPLVQALWGIALFTALLLLPVAQRLAGQPFGLPFWALSFPLAAFTSLTLRLADLQPESRFHGLLQNAGLLLLATTSLVILWLAFATVRGLRAGTLLAPEPVVSAQPAPA